MRGPELHTTGLACSAARRTTLSEALQWSAAMIHSVSLISDLTSIKFPHSERNLGIQRRRPRRHCLSSFTLSWTSIFQHSSGQLDWVLPAEMGSTRLRRKIICLARDSSITAGLIGGTIHQFMMNTQIPRLHFFRLELALACLCGLTSVFQRLGT